MYGCVSQSVLRLKPYLNLSFSSYSCIVLYFQTTTQKASADFSKGAKERQRAVRQCEFPACGVKAKDTTPLHKCAGCRVALYCSREHAALHRSEHESFCDELTQTCSYPKCEYQAEVRCRKCKVAMYCTERHRAKHSSAHESVCEELGCARRR